MKFKLEDFKFNEQGQMMAKFDEERGKYVLPIEALDYMSEEDKYYIERYSKNRYLFLAMAKCQNDFVDMLMEDAIKGSKSGEPITEEMIQEGQEMFKKKTYSYSEVKFVPFGITTGIFPYMDKPTNDSHPVLAVPATTNDRGEIEYDIFMITSAKDTAEVFRQYDSPIVEWQRAGLKNPSVIRVAMGRHYTEISFTRQDCFGKLMGKDIIRFLDMTDYVERSRFKEPLAFLCWLIGNKIGDDPTDNKILKIQSVEDVQDSKQANCVDLAVITYKMAKKYGGDYKKPNIGWIRWRVSDHKTRGLLTSIFTYDKRIFVFEYLKPGFGNMRCLDGKNYKQTLEYYGLFLKKHHPDKNVRINTTKQQIKVFNKKQLELVEDSDQFQNQEEFLEAIWPVKKFLAESKYYTSTRQFITEMLMDLKR